MSVHHLMCYAYIPRIMARVVISIPSFEVK